jgi:hypothetical protein
VVVKDEGYRTPESAVLAVLAVLVALPQVPQARRSPACSVAAADRKQPNQAGRHHPMW